MVALLIWFQWKAECLKTRVLAALRERDNGRRRDRQGHDDRLRQKGT